MRPYATLMQDYFNYKNDKRHYPFFSDPFSQLYFEDPKNKCILIRGCKDEYSHNGGEIKLTTEDKFALDRRLHGKHSFEEIYNIIKKQAEVLGINLQNIKKINIFDISHTDPKTNLFSIGYIDEKVNALQALNNLCPNCEHTKIASTACWGGKKDTMDRDLIDEVKNSIDLNNNWHENNIVEIDITPKNDQNTHIVVGKDGKPHISYCLDKDMYEKNQLPPTFTRHIHLLAKGKKNVVVVPQTHTFQNNQYRVTEGEGAFQELSINKIRQIVSPGSPSINFYPQINNNVNLIQRPKPIQIIQYQPIRQQYTLQNYKPQNQQPNNIIQTSYFVKKYNQPFYNYNNNVRYIVNKQPVIVKRFIQNFVPSQPNVVIKQPVYPITTQIKRPVSVINNIHQRNNNYQYNLPSTTNNNYYNNADERWFNNDAECFDWFKTQDYLNWITYDIKNQYPEYRNKTFSFQPLI